MASTDLHPAVTSDPDTKVSGNLISALVGLHGRIFGALEKATELWLPGLLARLTFAAVLFGYYINAAQTKLDGGIFSLSVGAYAQIVPPVIEAVGYDVTQIALPWTLIVYAGTYAEFLLPVLIVVGLFSRLSAIGMLIFIGVQSFVDIQWHGVTPEIAGAWFDRFQDAIIFDQRLLWAFPLMYLVLKGAGSISLDGLLGRLQMKQG
ncbi:MAG: DoxX family protein [Pseudomonadota bacterium]